MQTISATELARNTRQILDRVAAQGATLAVERNSATIAHITPAQKTMNALDALAELSLPPLTPKQGAAWLRESKEGFENSVRDPWA